MSINEDAFVSLLNLDTCDEKADLKLPEGEMGQQIRDAFDKDETGILVSLWKLFKLWQAIGLFLFQVTVVTAMGEESILAFKNMPKD